MLKSDKFKIVAVVLPIIIILVILEIVLRIIGPEYTKFNNRSQEYYTNPRGYHIPIRKEGKDVVYGLNYKQMVEGFRIPSDNSNLVSKKNAILGVGDSFTYGRGVKFEDIYLTQLDRLLEQDGILLGVENCGLVGADLEEVFTLSRRKVSSRQYSLVLYGFVLNDFGVLLDGEIIGSDFIDQNNAGYSYRRLRKISAVYNFIVHTIERLTLHKNTIRGYLDAFSGKNAQTKFETLRQMNLAMKSRGSRMVIVLFPLFYDFDNYPFEEIHEKMRSFCKENQISLLDLYPAFSKYRAQDLWVNPTDHHPNEIAHRLAAKELYLFLKKNDLLKVANQYE